MSYKALTPENCNDFKNFKYSEFKCQCGGKYCNGYPVPFSYDLAANLQNVRDHFGKPLHITSPLRCVKHNADVGGVKNSKHTKGWACDFWISGVSYDDLAAYVKTLPYFHYCYRVKKNQNVIHYDITPPNESITPNVERDETKDQLKVLAKSLRVRADHNTSASIIGYAPTNGIYNWYEMVRDGKYDWYRIAEGQWIANNGSYLEIYPKKEEEDQEMIDELNKQLKELNDKYNVLEAKYNDLEQLNEELINSAKSLKQVYKCPQNGSYKINIKLNKDEELYLKEV